MKTELEFYSYDRRDYCTTIEAPYVHASRIPFFLSLLRFKKKLTVMGMIGQTQGVNKASNPPINPAKKM